MNAKKGKDPKYLRKKRLRNFWCKKQKAKRRLYLKSEWPKNDLFLK